MAVVAQRDVTEWLQAWSDGDQAALEKLVPAVGDIQPFISRYGRARTEDDCGRIRSLTGEGSLNFLIGGLRRLSGALQVMTRQVVAAGGKPVFRRSDGTFEGNK